MNTAENILEDPVETTQAWLLPLRGERVVAIGHDELRHLLIEPPIYKLPHAPRFCQSLVMWEEHLLPLYDLAAFMDTDNNSAADETESQDPVDHIYAVIGFNLGVGKVDYGAISITEPPLLIDVNDDDVTDIDRQIASRKMVVKSNFEYSGKRVPIINIKYLFTGVFSG